MRSYKHKSFISQGTYIKTDSAKKQGDSRMPQNRECPSSWWCGYLKSYHKTGKIGEHTLGTCDLS